MRDAPVQVGVKFNGEDRAVLDALVSKLGINRTMVIRLAIRKLAEAEAVEVRKKKQK
jgi:hypothetical protein